MDKAKQAVSDFMSKAGHHDTTVHEKVAPGVVHENVTPTRHENVTTAVDKEIHQDHYHTSVQPVHDREVLPEKHSHNIVGVEKRSFEHGDARDDESRLAREAGQFRDETLVNDTKHTHSVAPAVAGEHIHHHVHETIQPVVQKETIQPNVVHTTVPIHEVHHNAAQHHSTSALPAVSMSDFKKQGGVLTGREERYDGFEGEPRSVGGALSGGSSSGTTGTTGTGSGLTGSSHSTGLTGDRTTGSHSGSGLTGSNTGSGLTGSNTGSGLTGSNTGSGLTGGTSGTSSDGLRRTGDSSGSGLTGSSHDRSTTGNTGTGTGTSTSGNKPSLMDKINPSKDSTGDGVAGFMK